MSLTLCIGVCRDCCLHKTMVRPLTHLMSLPCLSPDTCVSHRTCGVVAGVPDEDGAVDVGTTPLSSTTAKHISQPTRNLLRIANYTLHHDSIVAPIAAACGGVGIWPWEVLNSGSHSNTATTLDYADQTADGSMPAPQSGLRLLRYCWADAKFTPRLEKPGAGYPVRYGEVIDGGSAAVNGYVHLYCLCGEQEPADRILKVGSHAKRRLEKTQCQLQSIHRTHVCLRRERNLSGTHNGLCKIQYSGVCARQWLVGLR